MKTTLLLFLAFSVAAGAYTLSVTNQSTFGDPSLPIVDASGNPLAGGSIRLGYFNTLNDSQISNFSGSDASTLISDFTGFGTTSIGSVSGLASGLTENTFIEAFTDSDLTTAGIQDSEWTGVSPYLLVTNNSDAEYAVFKFNAEIGIENDAGAGSLALDLNSTSGSILLGQNGGAESLGAVSYSGSFQLTQIPEPTSASLLGLAGLALVARRKR